MCCCKVFLSIMLTKNDHSVLFSLEMWIETGKSAKFRNNGRRQFNREKAEMWENNEEEEEKDKK